MTGAVPACRTERRSGRRLRAGVLAAVLAACAAGHSALAPASAATRAYDLWIRGGTVVDGSGREGYRADVLVRGDAIATIEADPDARYEAVRTLDAAGRLVTPGFIDTHAHGDPLAQSFVNFLAQGITTVVLGQDGFAAEGWSRDNPGRPLGEWMRAVEERGSEVNIATLSGHNTLRSLAGVGDAPVPTQAQLQAMLERLEAELAAGSFGLSFGLEYPPGWHSLPAEQKALGDRVGAHGGIVMSHMRTEDAGRILEAVDELLQIDAHVHVSHLKIVAGKDPAEATAVLDRLRAARAAGRQATGDVYPYLASASSLVFLYPDWAKMREQYEDAVRHRRAELEAHVRSRVEARNGPSAILFAGGPYAGKRLSEVAAAAGLPYERAMIDLIGYGGPAQAHFLMDEAVFRTFLRDDHVNLCTDGAPGASHPRSAGSFVKLLTDYVGAPPKLSLAQAVHKMSGLAARTLGLDRDRGVLAPGRKADILVIDPARLDSRATYAEPTLRPTGMDYVIVNGRIALEQGEPTGGRAGRLLRRQDLRSHPRPPMRQNTATGG